MSAKLLNLTFTFPGTTLNALFDAPMPSRTWFDVTLSFPNAPPPGSQITQVPSNFNLSGGAKDFIPFQVAPNDDIYIRVAPSSSPSLTNTCIMVVSFGRDSGITSNFPSPFLFTGNSGSSITMPRTFYILQTANQGVIAGVLPSPDGSWIFYLGQPSNNGLPMAGDTQAWMYDFFVNAEIWNSTNQTEYYFGHEPQMVVTGG